jgi:hypothetical protein
VHKAQIQLPDGLANKIRRNRKEWRRKLKMHYRHTIVQCGLVAQPVNGFWAILEIDLVEIGPENWTSFIEYQTHS